MVGRCGEPCDAALEHGSGIAGGFGECIESERGFLDGRRRALAGSPASVGILMI